MTRTRPFTGKLATDLADSFANRVRRFATKILHGRRQGEMLRARLAFAGDDVIFRRITRRDSSSMPPMHHGERRTQELVYGEAQTTIQEGYHFRFVRSGIVPRVFCGAVG